MDSKKNLACPIHPKEQVSRVNLEIGAQQDIYCIECLLSMSGTFDKNQVIPFNDFVERAATYYEKNRKRVSESKEIPDQYQSLLDKRNERIEEITQHLENEKKRAIRDFDDLLIEVTKSIAKRKDEFCFILDQQMIIYKSNFNYFEKQLKKAFPSETDYELYPTKDTLFERVTKISNSTQLIAFVKNLKQDLNEQKLMANSEYDDDDELKRRMFIKNITEVLNQNLTKYPSYADNSEIVEKHKASISKAVDDALNSLFNIDNPFIDASLSGGSFPKSDIMKIDDFKNIVSWLPSEYKGRNWKLLFSWAKDGKAVSTILSKIKGHALTVLVWRNPSANKLFGGFMDEDWTVKNGYFVAKKPFLFNLTDKKKFEAKSGVNNGYCDTTSYGPCFGNDLYVDTNGNGYCNPSGYNFSSYVDVSGSNSFVADAYEIYALGS